MTAVFRVTTVFRETAAFRATAGAAPAGASASYCTTRFGSSRGCVVPTPVAGGLSFSSVEAGNAHACGIVIGSGAYCWGTNWTGQLGDGTNVDRLVPTRVVQ